MTETRENDTRQQIVASAARLLRQRGARKTTIVDIADAAGVSRATVYSYFKDKPEVIEAVARTSSQMFYRDMVNAMEGETTLEGQLGAAATFVVQTVRSETEKSKLRTDERAVLLTSNAQNLFMDCIDFLAPYIASARVKGEVRYDLDVRVAAEWFARVLFSLASTPVSTLDLDDPAVVRQFVMDHVVRGFSSAPATRRGNGPTMSTGDHSISVPNGGQ